MVNFKNYLLLENCGPESSSFNEQVYQKKPFITNTETKSGHIKTQNLALCFLKALLCYLQNVFMNIKSILESLKAITTLRRNHRLGAEDNI